MTFIVFQNTLKGHINPGIKIKSQQIKFVADI